MPIKIRPSSAGHPYQSRREKIFSIEEAVRIALAAVENFAETLQGGKELNHHLDHDFNRPGPVQAARRPEKI